MTNTDETAGTIRNLSATVAQYIRLLIEDTRLNVAEKLTRLLSAIALSALLTIVGTVALVFISIAVGFALAEIVPPLWSFIIVAGFYIVVLILLITCRTALLVNPIARFISSLLLPAPQKPKTNDDKPATLS
ncbi:MAG: phage holin family protein [Muribaculaceae bacterium]|nr:phage holin family protein [Muribaculaceae bacterium]